jgi:hypothetical protein
MGKYIKHFILITRHKLTVMWYCWRVGLFTQGIKHDLSKYGFKEFFTSAKYFTGTSSPIDNEKKKVGFSYSWQNHHNRNKHHWEYWVDFKNGEPYGVKIPFKYVLEMFIDMLGAGKIYMGKKWTHHDPLIFIVRMRDKRICHTESDRLLFNFASLMDDLGLKKSIKMIRRKKKMYKKLYDSGLDIFG